MRKSTRKYLSAAIVAVALVAADSWGAMPLGVFVSDAHAVIGRPLTPGSVAGASRRTTRRVIRRSTVYVPALPAGCAATSINGVAVWACGSTYYQAYGGRYVVVYVN